MTRRNNIAARLADYASHDLWRSRHVIDENQPTKVVIDNKELLHFCSNDYLNLSLHPKVIDAFANSARRNGAGSGSSTLISGYSRAHQQLEESFADFVKRDRALLFNSGYHANLGVITALADRHSTIIADKYCHASIIDGIVLSRAKHVRYRHNHVPHAESLLKQYSPCLPLIITESVFSMHGDIAPIAALANSAATHSATLIIDDAHGFGVLGKHGGGITDALELNQDDAPCLITPLGKAAGSLGALVSGSSDMIELLIQSARTYRYTTAIPAAVCDASIMSIKLIQEENWRRESLRARINHFTKSALERGLVLTSTDQTPVKSILFGSNHLVTALQHALIEKGFLVSCIRPPTVPASQAMIRISLNCEHTDNQITQLLDTLVESHAALQHDDE